MFDLGELVTWLNDAVLLAPTFLLDPTVTWGDTDDESFDVSVTDAGRSVTGRVFVDERGAPVDFSSTDRFADLPEGLTKARWTTPIAGWETSGARPIPTSAKAIWHLSDGPMTYAEGRFVPSSIVYDVAPGD